MQRPAYVPEDYKTIKVVDSLSSLFNAEFSKGVNCILYPRSLRADFNRLANYVDEKIPHEAPAGLVLFNRDRFTQQVADIRDKSLQEARDIILTDLLEMENRVAGPHHVDLRLIRPRGYIRNGSTDVHKFHQDGVAYPLGRLICVYNGPMTEVVHNDDVAAVQGTLYTAKAEARIFTFKPGDLWRQSGNDYYKKFATIPPFIHRAPAPRKSDPPRLMLVVT